MAMTPKRFEWIKEVLLQTYGRPPKRPPSDPMDELVQTILSQNTTDTNSERAFVQLKKQFPTWDMVRDAKPEVLARAIHCGGLAQIKSQRIIGVLQTIQQREGRLSLARVCGMPASEALAYLTDLEGVGMKTACCVLLFACGRPVMPVDTHVYRVSQRLGLLGGSVPIEKAHEALHTLIAPEDRYTMHILLIRHGRQTCHALRPECERCVLARHCPSGKGGASYSFPTAATNKAQSFCQYPAL
jgi:endonuclease-3